MPWPLLALVGAFSLLGCQRKMSVEEHRVSAAVREYNLALPRAYRAKHPQALMGKATEEQVGRIWALVLGLSQKGLVLESRRERAQQESITIQDEERAEAMTSEVWWYQHVDTKTRKVSQAPRRVRYKIRYHLVRKKGRWLVDKLETLKTDELKSAP